MKNATWVFGSVLAAGCMLLSVPAAAQGGFPQGGNFPQGGFPQGGNFPQGGFPQQGAGRNPALPGGAAAGKAKALAMFTVSDSLVTGEEMSAIDRQNSFTNMMTVALETACGVR